MKPRKVLYRFSTMMILLASLLYLSPPPRMLAQQESPPPPTMPLANWANSDNAAPSGWTSTETETVRKNSVQQTVAGDGTLLPLDVRDEVIYLPIINYSPRGADYPTCDYTISPGSISYDGASTPAGSTICLEGGTYSKIRFYNLQGTLQRPITITNLDGQVRVSGESWIYIRNCEHIRLTGTGTPGVEYGFYLGTVLRIYQQSHHIEIDHIETTERFDIKEDPGDPGSDPDFEMTDIHVHHCYFHDVGDTAIYIGKGWSDKPPNTYLVRRVEVDHNTLHNIGHKGIQIASCMEDCSIHHNVLTDQVQGTWHAVMAAIMINSHSDVDVFSNIIIGCKAAGIAGDDDTYDHSIYNNLLVDCGQSSTHDQEDAIIAWGDNNSVFNNTIIGANRYGIAFAGSAGKINNKAYNNIILETVSDPILQGRSPDGNFHHNHTKEGTHTSTNYGFVDPASGNYHLTGMSAALDAGADSGIMADLDGNPRPLGTRYDVGCYESSLSTLPQRTSQILHAQRALENLNHN